MSQILTPTDHLPPAPHDHLTSATTRAALLVQQEALVGAREHLRGIGLTEVMAPLLGPVTDPGTRGAKQVDVDYYGRRYKLMTSAILYKQASLLAFEGLFLVAPNVRLEPPETSSTRRHLVEFHQVDVEIAGAGRDELMGVARELLRAVVRGVLERCTAELVSLGRDPEALERVLDVPFDVLTHAEAIGALHELRHPQNPDAEIDWEGEELLSSMADRPFFVTDYPKGSRGFYDRESPERPGTLLNFDLIAPGGYGELISGSERQAEYAAIVARMRETGENPEKYRWYLDIARRGLPASAGFGLGLERLTRFLTGLPAVWQVCAYPKVPGVAAP